MMTRKELAAKLGIDVKTFKKHCEQKGIAIPKGKLLDLASCKEILAQFGMEEIKSQTMVRG